MVLNQFLLTIRFHFYSLESITSSYKIFQLLLFLKHTLFLQVTLLLDIVACDYFNKALRFGLTYVTLSLKYNMRLYITTFVNTLDYIPSILKIYKAANRLEREIWDLFGLFFMNHPDLRRILTDYGFHYFPLRKDFPLSGFSELLYHDGENRIIQVPVTLLQNHRFFSLKEDWTL